jgi:hypothetical protein
MKIPCVSCQYCVKQEKPSGEMIALICIHPKTCKSVSNPLGLRIDQPAEYLTNKGFPDWCPLEDVKE